MKEPLYDLGEKLYEILDATPEILGVDSVVIENQPTMKNPTMKSISMILFCYFLSKKFRNVKFISPSGKLKINEKLTKDILGKCDNKTEKYKVTKWLAIEYTNILLDQFGSGNNIWKIDLNKSKKKDDLCDAFLHAYYHLIGTQGINDNQVIQTIKDKFENQFTNKGNNTIVLDS
jgi:hypothetical protein